MEELNTPECCDDCKHQWTDDGCSQWYSCVKWRNWLHNEWLRIRISAALMSGGDLQRKLSDILNEEEKDDQGTTEDL